MMDAMYTDFTIQVALYTGLIAVAKLSPHIPKDMESQHPLMTLTKQRANEMVH
jgi:hypothetical protein